MSLTLRYQGFKTHGFGVTQKDIFNWKSNINSVDRTQAQLSNATVDA